MSSALWAAACARVCSTRSIGGRVVAMIVVAGLSCCSPPRTLPSAAAFDA
ncbi:MAG TPA: hypothetical protein VG410_02455 [Solirubrobacteraceae bacterium]|nr:hypothetical protein [Solirubrobacteraceae bacterium]